jgi:hypothetical protein
VRAPLAGVEHGRDLVRALRQGRAFVTSGPFLNVRLGAHGPGDDVELSEARVRLEVLVQIPHWMGVSTIRVYLGTELLRSLPIGPPSARTSAGRRYARSVSLTLKRSGPLVVTVEGDATLEPVVARRGVRPFAFTNPIWLRVPSAATDP